MRRLFILLALLPVCLNAQPASEVALAKKLLRELQPKSIQQSREFCGMIGVNADGAYVIGPVSRGSSARCTFRRPRGATNIVASFHTHGAYLPGYDNEVPSVIDLESEREQNQRGYVATPGGRFWLVDGRAGTVTLICGPKCLPWDPNFTDGLLPSVRDSYTMRDLLLRAR